MPESSIHSGIQIGPADIVATLSAGNSAWGWIGGLQGISSISQFLKDPFAKRKDIFQPRNLSMESCQMLTFHGSAQFPDPGMEPFGDSFSTKMVGLTICALAHEMGLPPSINMFMKNLVPGLMKSDISQVAGAQEALHSQLVDNGDRILNEGAARGLPAIFNQAILSSSFSGCQGRQYPEVELDAPRNPYTDIAMVRGLLNWISKDFRTVYLTRSATVARVALLLKAVGYEIGAVSTWDGQGEPPHFARSVVLVLGGSSPTDLLMETEVSSFMDPRLITHYRFSTIGAFMVNTIRCRHGFYPEVCQDYFSNIYQDLKQRLAFSWEYFDWEGDDHDDDGETELFAVPHWLPSPAVYSQIAVRLSSIYFARCAQQVASYYERIARSSTLDVVLKQKLQDGKTSVLPDEVVEFRVITVSILLSVTAILSGPEFETLHHATKIQLSQEADLSIFCRNIENLLSFRLSFSQIALCIAHIHCGEEEPDMTIYSPNREHEPHSVGIIGWRKGNYAVLPRLLLNLNMGPSEEVLGFQCTDVFIGNLPVFRDGSIKCNKHAPLSSVYKETALFESLLEQARQGDTEGQVVQAGESGVHIGVANCLPPDVPLYINIERPSHVEDPWLGLCGRVGGVSIGNFGVFDIFRGLIGSFDLKKVIKSRTSSGCVHQDDDQRSGSFFTVPASVWASRGIGRKPSGDASHIPFIPVEADAAWAVFLSVEPGSRISFGCPQCLVEESSDKRHFGGDKSRLIIGYEKM
ncbi:hypothetical protein BKA65DRAFT_514315 [Rhexocercosporidium sp. MPI-PUGE-AT-0058]|nr:hypothetical protein BKA65DRAFT_514315 [Rhexocercosporidium sp. MPI-PUGE-AT-0058]